MSFEGDLGMPSKRPWKASEWFVGSDNVLRVFWAHDLKMVFARNAQNKSAGASESGPACQMIVIRAKVDTGWA